MITWRNSWDVVTCLRKSGIGPLDNLEIRLADMYGTSWYSVSASSGTAALMMAISAFGVNRRHRILVPAYGFPAAANASRFLGYRIGLVDISNKTLCMSQSCLEKELERGAGLVIYVCQNGCRDGLKDAYEACRHAGIPFICDAAVGCGMLNEYGGKFAQFDGDIIIFSFSVPKMITGFQGGMAIAKRHDMAMKMKRISDQGISGTSSRLAKWHVDVGANFKMNPLSAALINSQLREAHWRACKRMAIFGWIRQLHMLHTDLNDEADAWWPTIWVDDPSKMIEKFNNAGIEAARIYRPLYHFPTFKTGRKLSGAESVWNHLVYLPFNLRWNENDVNRIFGPILEDKK